jgi:hypothetical protein
MEHGMSTFRQYQKEIDEVCEKVLKTQSHLKVTAIDGAEIYGYPRSQDRVAWGVNGPDGYNILRGIRRPDGRDEGVM